MNNMSQQFEQALMALNRLAARNLIEMAVVDIPALKLVDQVVVPALTRIGNRWASGEADLSQVYMSGRICEELVDRLLPPGDPQRKEQPPMAIAALDDYHLLGKRIVYAVLRAAGFAVKDYGRVTADEVIVRVKADRIKVLLLSTLMLNSALHVAKVVDDIKAAGLDVKVVVGGAPFNFDDQLWREVKADATAVSAAEVVDLVNAIMEEVS